MSFSISGTSPATTYASQALTSQTDPNPSSSASTTTSPAALPKSQYLGGYISSATAALSLLTQTATAESERSETTTVDANGTTVDADGFDFLQQATGLGTNVFAQAYAESTNFKNVAGSTVGKGQYQAEVASATSLGSPQSSAADSTDSSTAITASLSTGSGYFGTVEEGLNANIEVGNNPKDTDAIFISANFGNLDTVKQTFEEGITGFLEWSGLDDTAAEQQSEQLTNFIFSAAEKIATPQPTATAQAASGTAAPATTSSSSSDSSSAPTAST